MNHVEVQSKLAVVKMRDGHKQLIPQLRIAGVHSEEPNDQLRIVHISDKDIHDLKTVAEEVGQSVEEYIAELVEVRMVELRQIKAEAALAEAEIAA